MTEEEFRQQLLDRLSNTTIEIRFVKEQQYRTVYYSLLLFAAIIGVFQIPVSIKPYWIYLLLKVIAFTTGIYIMIISLCCQRDHSKALMEYREGLKDSMDEVCRYSERKSRRCEKRINRKKNISHEQKQREIEKVKNKTETNLEMKKRWNRRYVRGLMAVTILGAAATGVVLWFD